jgi:hypothetical protein
MTNENTCWVTNTDGTWALSDVWSGGSLIKGRVVAACVAVAPGTSNYRDIAESLLKALASWDGAWVEDCTFCFVHGGETVVEFVIHAAGLKVDAGWVRDGQWFGNDGVDVSGMVRKTDSAVR